MRTLADMGARALRQLDGMAVNRDAMAKDVLQLIALIRAIERNVEIKPRPDRKQENDMPEFFRDIFGGRSC